MHCLTTRFLNWSFFFLYDVSGSDSTGSCLYSDQHGDRYKRRRMLQFSDGSAGGYAQNSPLPYENVISSPSTTYSYSSYSSSCGVRHLSFLLAYQLLPSILYDAHGSNLKFIWCTRQQDSSLSSVCSGSDCMLQPHDSPTFPTSSWFSGPCKSWSLFHFISFPFRCPISSDNLLTFSSGVFGICQSRYIVLMQRSYADNSSFMLPNAQQSVDKWTSSFDNNQSYSAVVQMWVCCSFTCMNFSLDQHMCNEIKVICFNICRKSFQVVLGHDSWISCFSGNRKCNHLTVASQLLLRCSHHKPGNDRHHPHHSLISPYINIHHLKCFISNLFRKFIWSKNTKWSKNTDSCKVHQHPSQSLLSPLVKFHFITTFIAFVDRLLDRTMPVTSATVLELTLKTWWSHIRKILTTCTLGHLPGQMKPSSGPSRFKTKLPLPVALPFAMLKPSAAQGDVTLNDINKRLLSPPPTPGDIKPFSLLNEKKPPTLPGAGLSGKSVVTCTKIHTEGAGTITIMRTKG